MKIRYKAIDDVKGAARIQKNMRGAAPAFEPAVFPCRFKRAHGRSADRNHRSSLFFCRIDRRCGLFGDGVIFAVHGVVFNAFGAHGQKGSQADVERQAAHADAFSF